LKTIDNIWKHIVSCPLHMDHCLMLSWDHSFIFWGLQLTFWAM
jgi:hypothetical protein